MTKTEIGKRRINEILKLDADRLINEFASVSPDFANYIIDFAYGDLYARKGISDKTRELAAVACMLGQGCTGTALKTHLKGMLNVGWTKQELIEVVIFLIAFVGFPVCVDASELIKHL